MRQPDLDRFYAHTHFLALSDPSGSSISGKQQPVSLNPGTLQPLKNVKLTSFHGLKPVHGGSKATVRGSAGPSKAVRDPDKPRDAKHASSPPDSSALFVVNTLL